MDRYKLYTIYTNTVNRQMELAGRTNYHIYIQTIQHVYLIVLLCQSEFHTLAVLHALYLQELLFAN